MKAGKTLACLVVLQLAGGVGAHDMPQATRVRAWQVYEQKLVQKGKLQEGDHLY